MFTKELPRFEHLKMNKRASKFKKTSPSKTWKNEELMKILLRKFREYFTLLFEESGLA